MSWSQARPPARPARRTRSRGLRTSLAAGLGLLVLSLLANVEAAPGSPALGPAPRAADGRFSNPVGMLSRADLSIQLPFFVRRIAGSFRERAGAPARVENDGAFLRENAKHSKPTVTWIGHATMLVQMDHVTFLTDPIWSDTASPVSFAGPRRFVPPGLRMEDLPPIDFVVVSHNHYDHLDVPTLVALSKRNPETRFFVPLQNGELLRESGIDNVEELDWGASRTFAGVQVHCLPAQHWSKRGFGDDRKALWSSWAVTGPERRFFFAGDTGYFAGFRAIGKALGPFDLAAVPIGAYEPVAMMKESHMNPEEAVQAAIDLRSRRALAMHYGTFDLSDEPLSEPPARFRKAVDASPLRGPGGWLFRIGETREF